MHHGTFLFAAVLGGLALMAISDPPAPAAASCTVRTDDEAASCGKCHTEIHDEWKGRDHATAWTNPVYRAAIEKKRRPQLCWNCHIPRSVLDRLGKKPRSREEHREEGVTCVACHKQDGEIHGPFGAETDAHPSVKDDSFTEEGSVALCSSCHSTKIGPVLPLGRDFPDSEAKSEGKSCVSCHMPEVERHIAVDEETGEPVGSKRKGRSHVVLGPEDADFVVEAFEPSVRVDGGELVFEVANRAGHRVPGLKLRRFELQVAQLAADGKTVRTDTLVIDGDEEPLPVDESLSGRWPLGEGAVAVEVTLDHLFEGEKIASHPLSRTEL